MGNSRKDDLGDMVRDYVFNLLENEIEFSGGDAGKVAARVQRMFETEYQLILDEVPGSFGECSECGHPLDEDGGCEECPDYDKIDR